MGWECSNIVIIIIKLTRIVQSEKSSIFNQKKSETLPQEVQKSELQTLKPYSPTFFLVVGNLTISSTCPNRPAAPSRRPAAPSPAPSPLQPRAGPVPDSGPRGGAARLRHGGPPAARRSGADGGVPHRESSRGLSAVAASAWDRGWRAGRAGPQWASGDMAGGGRAPPSRRRRRLPSGWGARHRCRAHP